MNSRRRVNSTVIHRRYLKTGKGKNNLLLVKVVVSRATRHGDGESLTQVARSGRVEWSARPTRAVDNKSLDRSAGSTFRNLIDRIEA